MSTDKPCAVGDIVHVTRFSGKGTEAWGFITVVGALGHGQHQSVQFVDGPPDFMAEWGGEDWDLTRNEDSWTILFEDEVPDHYWAALAEWRLTS